MQYYFYHISLHKIFKVYFNYNATQILPEILHLNNSIVFYSQDISYHLDDYSMLVARFIILFMGLANTCMQSLTKWLSLLTFSPWKQNKEPDNTRSINFPSRKECYSTRLFHSLVKIIGCLSF